MTGTNRTEAGRALAHALDRRAWTEPPLVLAIGADAVPVAFEVAHRLHAELDLLETRPFTPRGRSQELGVVSASGMRVVHGHAQVAAGLSDEAVAEAAAQAVAPLQAREHAWRRRHPRPEFTGRTVIVVAERAVDGRLAGACLLARSLGAGQTIAASPLAIAAVWTGVRAAADEAVCLTEEADAAALPDYGPPPDDAGMRALLERAEEWRAPVVADAP